MAWTRREVLALVVCIAIGAAAVWFLLLLDQTDANPDGLLWIVAALVGLAVVGLAFGAQVARVRFLLAGVVLSEATYLGTWLAIVLSNPPVL